MQKDNFNNKLIRIGSRSSPLAIWQAKEVQNKIGKNSKVIKILTTGDKILDSRLAKYGGKGLFTRELDEAIEKNKIDIETIIEEDKSGFWKRAAEAYLIGNQDEFLRQNINPSPNKFYRITCCLTLLFLIAIVENPPM